MLLSWAWASPPPSAPPLRRTFACDFALVVSLYVHEAATVRQVDRTTSQPAPLLRFTGWTGWRMAAASFLSCFVMVGVIIAAPFATAVAPLAAPDCGPASPLLASLLLVLGGGLLTLLTAVILLAALLHELGHALALAAFGHRGIVVSLVPFGGGAAIGARDCKSEFEAGVVALAGPALCGAVGLALLPDPIGLSQFLRGAVGEDAGAFAAAAPGAAPWLWLLGAVFVFCLLISNVPNILPWTASDGMTALDAMFSDNRLRLAGAAAAIAIIATFFGSPADILPFGMFIGAMACVMARLNRGAGPAAGALRRPADDIERLAVAALFALTLAAYAAQVSTLRRVGWADALGLGATAAETKPAKDCGARA